MIPYCTNVACAAFQAFGTLIYLDIACAALLLLEAVVLLWRLRRQDDRTFFVVPAALGLLALALAWRHWLLYLAEDALGAVPPWTRQLPIYDAWHPADWGFTVVLLILTALLVCAGLVKAVSGERRWTPM
jgi:hypothetical protein